MNDVDRLKRELLDKLRLLRGNYSGRKHSIISLIRTISKHACEEKIKYLLENKDNNESKEKFDPYYKLKSDFATLKILEFLKSRLIENGLNVTVQTEMPSDIGRYDVAIVQGDPCQIYTANSEKVRIEVKASLGLDFEQLDRYLWDSSTLILVRVLTGQVATLRPSELRPHIRFSLSELNTKVDRLLSGRVQTVPGKDCYLCHKSDCPHCYGEKHCRRLNVITLSDKEFNDDLNSFFKNLSYVADKTVKLIIEELNTKPPT